MTTKPPAPFAVSIVWLNGVKTVTTIHDEIGAKEYAQIIADTHKGCLVYLGNLVARSTTHPLDEYLAKEDD